MGDPDSYVGTYEFQVPIFVLTHHPPGVAPKQDDRLTFTFVTDGFDSGLAQAKSAARGKAVQLIGGVVREALRRGAVDELRIDVIPVMLGDGIRFLEGIEPEHLRFEKAGVRQVGPRTTLAYRIYRR